MVKEASGVTYSLSALRAVVLDRQWLTTPNGSAAPATADAIVDLVTALGYVQIDTLHVVNRAHYVILWSRFGAYDVDALHRLLYTPGERRLYEGWGHAASIIPLHHFRYHRWRVERRFHEWLEKEDNRALAGEILARIRADGALRVGDLDYDGPKRDPWYDWKPSKMALETLFAQGELMVAGRVNFHRVYDVPERVLPDWVDTTPVAPDAARRFLLEHAAKALGVFDRRSLTWYAYMMATPARPILKALFDEGVFVEIQGESIGGDASWFVHRDNLQLLQRAAEGEIRPERTTFLSPFDSFFWAGKRDQKLWGFNQLLEAYKRPADRVYGYFCFPILHRDRLVGRFDPKLDRQSGVLNLNALYLEPGVEPDGDLIAHVAAAMRDFLAWHGATALRIDKSDPPAFGAKLLRAL